MLNIAFCDDDSDFLERIKLETTKIFKSLNVYTSINLFTDANLLIEKFKKYNPYFDIVFLDIDMPAINGKEAARRLRLVDRKFKLIFVTSFEDEVLNTFQYDASGFLPKLLLEERLPSVIERVVRTINEENPQIQIFEVSAVGNKLTTIKVPLNDIMYIESINRKIYLHTKRDVYMLSGYKFTNLVNNYCNFGFIDIHRTCIVNLKYIFSIDDIEVRLDDGTSLPLSRRKRQAALDRFAEKICEVTKCKNY